MVVSIDAKILFFFNFIIILSRDFTFGDIYDYHNRYFPLKYVLTDFSLFYTVLFILQEHIFRNTELCDIVIPLFSSFVGQELNLAVESTLARQLAVG